MILTALAFLLAAPAAPDHTLFDGLLRRHVAEGRVDYDAFARAPELPRYLSQMEAVRPDALGPKDRLAFWINLYNAYTIRLITERGERASIRNIEKALVGGGPWKVELVRTDGRVLSLDEVEHGIVRKQFQEPRIHFALVCGARGCPPLRGEAYTGARLEEQLEDQARRFLLATPEKNRVDVAAGVFYASPILADWYRSDFGADAPAMMRWVARYFPPGAARSLLESGRAKVTATDYDWSLNGG